MGPRAILPFVAAPVPRTLIPDVLVPVCGYPATLGVGSVLILPDIIVLYVVMVTVPTEAVAIR